MYACNLALGPQIAQALVVHDGRPDVGVGGEVNNSLLQRWRNRVKFVGVWMGKTMKCTPCF